MLDNQEVRQHLRMGEQAVTLLTSMGYRYERPKDGPHVWVAPEEKKVDPKEVLAKFLRDQAEVLSPTPKFATTFNPSAIFRTSGAPPIPAGRRFTVEPHRIPKWHSLFVFNANHFRGVNFEVIRCFQPATEHFPIGWAVEFRMRTTPFEWENVWLPLSACAFH
jgi:hypothetical protein